MDLFTSVMQIISTILCIFHINIKLSRQISKSAKLSKYMQSFTRICCKVMTIWDPTNLLVFTSRNACQGAREALHPPPPRPLPLPWTLWKISSQYTVNTSKCLYCRISFIVNEWKTFCKDPGPSFCQNKIVSQNSNFQFGNSGASFSASCFVVIVMIFQSVSPFLACFWFLKNLP